MRDNYVCNSISISLKYSLGLSIILLSPLEWILRDKLEEGEIDIFDKQGNVEERRETGEFSKGTNRSEISGHLPAENRTGTILHCNANMKFRLDFLLSPAVVPWNTEICEGLLPETTSEILNHATAQLKTEGSYSRGSSSTTHSLKCVRKKVWHSLAANWIYWHFSGKGNIPCSHFVAQ